MNTALTPVALPELFGERDASRGGYDATLNAVGLESGGADVLAAANSSAHALSVPHDLQQEPSGITRARQVMAVAAVIAEDVIPLFKVLHYAD
jgi:hypothetical protein